MLFKNAKAIIALLIPAALAGCGGGGGYGGGNSPGGGGGGNTQSAVVLGKVVDLNGNVVPGARVSVDDHSAQVTTLSQGSFRLDTVSAGVHRLYASAQANGIQYSGSTQVLALNNTTDSNADIQLSPTNQQATIEGSVRDRNNRPLPDARVFLGVLVTAPSGGSSGNVASLVAFADSNGHYQIQNVPTAFAHYTLAASLLNYQNASAAIDNLQPGETRTQDFQLYDSFNQSVLTPTNLFLQSFTQPSTPLLANAVQARSAAGGVYEQIRRALSPRYAGLAANRHAAAHTKHLQPHNYSAFGNSVIEMDLLFSEGQTQSLSGFRIYNSTGSAALAAYDFLQDPLADIYTDIDPSYVPNQSYNFAVSAVNTDGTETPISQAVSTAPLDLLSITRPQQDQALANPVTITWNPVNGASSYAVFVYSAFPGIDTPPIAQSPTLGAGTNSYTLPGTLAPNQDYWVVTAASDSAGDAVSVSQVTHFTVTP